MSEQKDNQVVRREFNAVVESRFHDTAATAVSAQQKAMVEARCVVAQTIGRSWENVRAYILKQCADPDFAIEALYAKPIGATPNGWKTMTKREQLINAPQNWPRGFSIRFIEAVIAEAGNYDVKAMVTWEDDFKRITLVMIWDIFKNNNYERSVITEKTVERKKKPDDPADIIGQRQNSYGDTVYRVTATPADVDIAEAAGVSKAIRTLGERLIPPNCKREWEERLERTLRDKTAEDPEKEKKRILDVFFQFGVSPSDVEEFLSHSLSALAPAEYPMLRGILVTISEGQSTWREVMEYQKHANDDEHDMSPGAKRVQESIGRQVTKQDAQKEKLAAQAKEAEERAAAESGKQQETKQEQKPAETTEQKKPDTGEWVDRPTMEAAFGKIVQELDDEKKAWEILGKHGISEQAELSLTDKETLAAFHELQWAVAEKKTANRPIFGRPKK